MNKVLLRLIKERLNVDSIEALRSKYKKGIDPAEVRRLFPDPQDYGARIRSNVTVKLLCNDFVHVLIYWYTLKPEELNKIEDTLTGVTSLFNSGSGVKVLTVALNLENVLTLLDNGAMFIEYAYDDAQQLLIEELNASIGVTAHMEELNGVRNNW